MLHTTLCCGIWGVCVCPWQDLVCLFECVPGRTLLHSPPQESPHCAHPTPRQHTLHPPWLLPAHLVQALTQDIFWFQIPVCNPWGQKSQ